MSVSDTQSNLPGVHNRFAPDKHWVSIQFRHTRALQSAELNELQAIIINRAKKFGNALFKEGAVIDGAVARVTGDANDDPNFAIEGGLLYFAGAVNPVDAEALTLPFDSIVSVGIRYREYEVTEADDITLLDPAVGTRNHMEAGAGRRVSEWHWGWSDDRGANDAEYSNEWSFFPIYEVRNGVLVIKEPPAVSDPVRDLIARYDREAHGNYVVRGLDVEYIEETPTHYRLNIKEGVANVMGYKLDRATGEGMLLTKNPEVLSSVDEPHTFTPDPLNGNRCVIWINRSPLGELTRVTGVLRKTVTINRGPVAGGTDELPDAAVLNIEAVWQGATVYVKNTDFTQQGDNVNWQIVGDEPAPGSSYNVTYTYREDVTGDEDYIVDTKVDHIVVQGFVDGSVIDLDYTYKLTRTDLVVLNANGTLERIQGISQRRNPVAPKAATHQIALAEIEYDWFNPPTIRNVAIRAMKMSDITEIQNSVGVLFDLMALERLKTAVAMDDNSAKHGVFVDAFNDDALRDQGEENQTASIVDGVLQCPVSAVPMVPNNTVNGDKFWTLPFVLVPIVEQPIRTGSMKVNPYQAFDPLPAKVQLRPAVDRWEVHRSVWTSPITRRIGRGNRSVVVSTVQVVSRRATAVPFIRQRSVAFTITGFGPGETLSQVLFDGVNVTPP